MLIAANNDFTSSNYYTHTLYNGGAAASNSYGGFLYSGVAPKDDNAAGVFGATIVDLLDYSSVSKNKTFRSLSGADNNTIGSIFFSSGLWNNTAAVNTLTLSIAYSGNLAAGTTFGLYGIK
jgi:hypothetical protein